MSKSKTESNIPKTDKSVKKLDTQDSSQSLDDEIKNKYVTVKNKKNLE